MGQRYIQEATSGLVRRIGVFLKSVLGYIWKLPVLPALPGVLAIPVEPAIPVLFTVPPVVSKEISDLKIRIAVNWKCPLGCVKINRNQQ